MPILKPMRRVFFAFSLVFFLGFPLTKLQAQEECTVGVAVGKATTDGRPVLWKNRDTSHVRNAVVYFQGKRFPFLAVVNAGDTTQVWMGVNAAGFAIMNSEAKDLEGSHYDDEGFLMKRALGTCASVADFELLLARSNGLGRAVTSNFGVIDALGNGAFFETGNHTATRFDANDPTVAPSGFLVRANFAFTGIRHGYGFERYGRAFRLFSQGIREGILGPKFIAQQVARDVTPEPWAWMPPTSPVFPQKLDTRRTINRYRTASAAIFQGVKKGEDPGLTTFWLNLGEPVCGITVPLWVASGHVPEALRGPEQPEINRLARCIRQVVHPDTAAPALLNLSTLQNPQRTGILQKTLPVEEEIFVRTQKALARWRRHGVNPEEMRTLQNWAAQHTVQVLREVYILLQSKNTEE